MAKIAIKRTISNDFLFENSSDMVQYLSEKFSDNLLYHFHEVDVKALEQERAEDSLKVYNTIDGSSTLQVAVFTPNSETFKAAPRLCLCDSRLSKYGSCEMFKMYQLNCTQPKANFLQSQYQTELTEDTEVTNIGLIIPETFCAIATSSTSADTVWFVKIVKECVAAHDIEDDYGHKMSQGQHYVVRNFMERTRSTKKGLLFK